MRGPSTLVVLYGPRSPWLRSRRGAVSRRGHRSCGPMTAAIVELAALLPNDRLVSPLSGCACGDLHDEHWPSAGEHSPQTSCLQVGHVE